ncbi:hypothetical protein TRFO_21236 [Tritrichomonas foetus]|uniref:DOCKER Lobe A domain-containing protein n=1 Tax=Tritrichomonas foetus TaxID=1144522 RepID=A0A1J4KJ72_9EUKA|nr:hypothetical protein TRFO_21236 [Tritrichomonas foetus]|eukprot:OHT09726.1 hypothetical protein TRFO_21236 [Tritrichomonas foetus]
MSSFRPLFTATQIQSPPPPSRIHSDFCDLHEKWFDNVVRAPAYQYTPVTIQPLPPPQVVEYNNDFNLTEEDSTSLNGKLENGPILQFLKRSTNEQDLDSLGLDFQPISNLVKSPQKPKTPFNIPNSISAVSEIYFKVTIDCFTLLGKTENISGVHGAIYMFDSESKTVLTDSATFAFSNGKFVFIQTQKQETYFQVKKPTPKSMIMVCVLSHENAASIDSFIESLSSNCQVQALSISTPVPFAFSYLNPLEGEVKKTFNMPWAKLNTPDALKNIGLPPDEENSISINGQINCEIVPYNEMPETCFNVDTLRNKPLLCLTSAPKVTDPVISMHLSNIQFVYNNSPKGEFVYFKLFVCNETTDPFKPDGLKCISSKSIDLLLDCYISYPIPAGRKLYFPDVIRILIEKPLPSTAHLIFHIMVLSHNTPNISKICIMPLFQDGIMIQTPNVVIPVSPLKRIKSDEYLSKIKSSSKTNMMFNFNIPIFIYPPKYFSDFAYALVPQQVQWTQIIGQTTQDNLIILALPILSKLLRIISPLTAEYFVDFIYRLKQTDVKDVVRRWIYSNFDPKTIKHNFTSSFTNSFDQLIQNAIDSKPELIMQFINAFDILSDILIVSYHRRTEAWIPASIFNFFARVTQLICFLIRNKDLKNAEILNRLYGTTLFKFCSICDDPASIDNNLLAHIRLLIQLDDNFAFFCVFDFLIPFTYTNEFAIYIAKKLPVRPLNNIMFSPFNPIVSLICLAVNKTMTSDERALKSCIRFLNDLFLPLEIIEPSLSYRIGFAFFPILDIISSFYASELLKSSHYDFLPTILFLLGYTPTQLLKNFFVSMSPNFQTLFIEFLALATESVIENLTPQITIVNGLYDQLTQRCLQFLWLNLNYFVDPLPSVIKLISHLVSPYQIPYNFPKIFDIVSRLINIYPCQRNLVQNLLEVVTRKQHIARCFATSLILLFFKADFDARRSVTVSSVEVIDALTSLLLHSPVEQISLFKQMIAQIQNFSQFFQNEALTSKLNERMIAANNIAEVIEKLRLATHPPDERCVYVMEIANQHKTFPSMRMKWLKEIVRINVQSGNFPSAFVAQLHICALISTVFMHEETLNSQILSTDNKDFNFNLIVCQPIRNARTKGSGKYMLGERDFSFFPSVMVETQIDFESISSDFQFISSDFTIELLKQAIEDAITYGDKSRMFYDSRCLRSLQMRIFATERNYSELAKVAAGLNMSFHELTVGSSSTHETPLSFFVRNNKVYCLASDSPKIEKDFSNDKCIPVLKYDPTPDGLEHLHCWKLFREIVKRSDIEKVNSADEKSIKLIQYTTREELPRFTMFSEVIDVKHVDISLAGFTELETEKLRLLMQQSSMEFEKCFPCRNLNAIEGNYKQNMEQDMGRIVALFKLALEGEESVFDLLKLLRTKGNPEKAQELAARLRSSVERLLKVYHRGIEYYQSQNHYLIFKEMREHTLAFITEFGLPDINSKSYEGKRDPLTEHIEYEIN